MLSMAAAIAILFHIMAIIVIRSNVFCCKYGCT